MSQATLVEAAMYIYGDKFGGLTVGTGATRSVNKGQLLCSVRRIDQSGNTQICFLILPVLHRRARVVGPSRTFTPLSKNRLYLLCFLQIFPPGTYYSDIPDLKCSNLSLSEHGARGRLGLKRVKGNWAYKVPGPGRQRPSQIVLHK